jgi:hypothetical protein
LGTWGLHRVYLHVLSMDTVIPEWDLPGINLPPTADCGGYKMHTYVLIIPLAYLKYLNKYVLTENVSTDELHSLLFAYFHH